MYKKNKNCVLSFWKFETETPLEEIYQQNEPQLNIINTNKNVEDKYDTIRK